MVLSFTQKIKKILQIHVKNFKTQLNQFFAAIKLQLGRTNARIASALLWIKSRPKAVKIWQKNDKKKKKYRSFRLQKRIKPEPRYIPSSIALLKSSFTFLFKNKRVFLAILFLHAAVYITVIRSPVTANFSAIEESLQTVLGDERNSLQASALALGAVLGASNNTQANVAVTSISVALMSLVYVWAIRQLHAGELIKARDAFYQGFTPLISSLIILFIASLQLIPFMAASFVYSTARAGGLFANGFEDLAIFTITAFTALLSFYWLTSTIIGLYIVTLPGMYPLRALQSARELVQFQRLAVFKRVLALPILLGVFYIMLLLLFIRFASAQVFLLVEVLQILVLPLVHVYLYKLYRTLI